MKLDNFVPFGRPQSGTVYSRDRYIIIHIYRLVVEAGYYSDVVECLPLGLAAQIRFPPRAVGIFLHPVTFGWQYQIRLKSK